MQSDLRKAFGQLRPWQKWAIGIGAVTAATAIVTLGITKGGLLVATRQVVVALGPAARDCAKALPRS